MRILLLLLIDLIGVAKAQSLQKKIQQVVDSVYAANPAAVGFLCHVEAPGQHLSFDYATGYSNRETKEKLRPQQPVLVASNTKPYVAAAILKLEEHGKLSIGQPIKEVLSTKTLQVLSGAGYEIDQITIKHLLSHTAGIRDYVDSSYFDFIGRNRQYAWTRDEQIQRAANAGQPLGLPGSLFKYADVNYVLLTEAIEQITGMPYYAAIRSLLDYQTLGLHDTRFAKFEIADSSSQPMAHQYWDEFGWDCFYLDPSWDLYGGGGIIATVQDLALFFRSLFEGQVIDDKKILSQMTEDVPPNLDINYCLGIRKIKVDGLLTYNHGGGLGSDVSYFPALNLTIAVAASEASHRLVALQIRDRIAQVIQQQNTR